MWTKALKIPATRRLTLPDVLVALWAAAWIALAVAVAVNTSQVAKLGGTVSQTGNAISQVGGLINDVPLVSGDVGSASQSVQQAGQSAAVNGNSAGDAANRLAVYLGIAIAIIPSVPILGLYLPIRLSRVREARVARRSLAVHGSDPRFQEFLARRAVEHLPYEDIMAVSDHPWDDVRAGRFGALASAELHRMEIYEQLPPATAEAN